MDELREWETWREVKSGWKIEKRKGTKVMEMEIDKLRERERGGGIERKG